MNSLNLTSIFTHEEENSGAHIQVLKEGEVDMI